MRIFFAAVTAVLVAITSVGAEHDPRPNILLCVADDWGWPHAGAYGDRVVKTPAFDRVAREGVLFRHAFSAAPSCTPSRGAMLTGQYPHRLEQGGNLWSFLPARFPTYPALLEKAGYRIGLTRKGWGPGKFAAGGYARNPAGPHFKSFTEFMNTAPQGQPFCFWLGSSEPHRPYAAGAGRRSGMRPEEVALPPNLPNVPEVREDVLDYYSEVQEFDRQVAEALELLEGSGQAENTLVVITSDNGWPFPRGKANIYDAGSRQPLAVRWPKRVRGGRTPDDFINLLDLAATFLEAAGLPQPAEMNGRSFLRLLTGEEQPGSRDRVYLERERHADVRANHAGYPMRGVRTRDWLYIRNPRPDRWPAGDPDHPRVFGDCDDGPSKAFMLAHAEQPEIAELFRLCFGKRPAEELYDLRKDPPQVVNVAGQPGYRDVQDELRRDLQRWMRETGDPRATSEDDPWDRFPYFGPAKDAPARKSSREPAAARKPDPAL